MSLDRDVIKLETLIQIMREDIARHESEMKELFGAVKHLGGQVEILSEHEQIHEQFRQIQTRFSQLQAENNKQQKDIGHLYGVLQTLTDAMSKSADRTLAQAAAGITINVEGGRTTNFNDSVNQANLNTGSGTQNSNG